MMPNTKPKFVVPAGMLEMSNEPIPPNCCRKKEVERAVNTTITTVFIGWNHLSFSKSKAKIISEITKVMSNPTVKQKKLSWKGC